MRPTPIEISPLPAREALETPRFIEIIGVPPPNSEKRIGPNERIQKSPNPKHIIDALDVSNEDPFTLEALKDIIQLHIDKKLDFILARVQTVDPTDESRMYYSYYAAHHLNKVLFRTENRAGFLHRMNALNPLNNMPIVGDVHYYCIASSKRESLAETSQINEEPRRDKIMKMMGFTSSPLEPFMSSKPTNITFVLKQKDELKSKRLSFDDAYADSKPSELLSQPKQSSHITTRHHKIRSLAYSNDRSELSVSEWITRRKEKSPTHLMPTSASSTSPHKRHTRITISPTSPQNRENYQAYYLASDDDYLMHPTLRIYFKLNSLDENGILFDMQSSGIDSGHEYPVLDNLLLLLTQSATAHPISRTRFARYLIPAYFIISFLVLKFIVPSGFVYIAAILLFLLLCILVVVSA